ncbi:MAG TPA: asparagine synthase (glutamine-hydrolyzing) [Planctomycetota bacterium]|nr:asparagine synthase (glutamine-hydrolyzing) [Planctomycetota bacterium]
MCGIAGIVDLNNRWSREDLARIARSMADAMPYRGPDDSGVWVSPDGRCALSHRRLSIIDTSSGGHQPFVLPEDRHAITFNGEIYNYRELKDELSGAGHTFATRSDTEVLLQLLVEADTDALARLDGQFAFGFWRTKTRDLLLARDPFGEKPLYWTEGDGWFAFASELHALTRVPGFDATIDADTIAEYLALQYVDAPRSIYRRANKLKPGHWLRLDGEGRVRIGRHFAFEPRGPVRSPRPMPELADELEQTLLRLVRRRMIADVPLGAFLSGGVDSSTVVALMTKALGGAVKTFSIGFANSPGETEHVFAREVAQHLGTEHHEQVLELDVLPLLHHIGTVLDEPNGDSSCLPTFLVSKVAKEHVTVCLSGDGGDEMFGGYGRYFATLQDESRLADFDPGRQYYSSRMLVYMDEHLAELFGEVPPRTAALLASFRRRMRREPGPLLHRMRAHDAAHYMPGAVLAKVDRMSMQHSLEVRTPLLSRELAAFCEQLAVEDCYSPGGMFGPQGKLVLKQVAQRYIPRAWLDRRKMGFGVPTKTGWGKERMVDWLREMTLGGDSKLSQWIDKKGREAFVRRMASDSGFSFYQAWLMLVLEVWMRSHSGVRGDDATTPALPARPLDETRRGDLRQEDLLLWQALHAAPQPPIVFCDDALPPWVHALPSGSVVVTPDAVETPPHVGNRVLAWNRRATIDAERVATLPLGPAVFLQPLAEASGDLLGLLGERTQTIVHRVGNRWHVRRAAEMAQVDGPSFTGKPPRLSERLFGHKLTNRPHELVHGGGRAWRIRLPRLARERALDSSAQLVVFEDGRPLPLGDSSVKSVAGFGRGRYCLEGEWLHFSATDNSDPTTNGRRYLAALRSTSRNGVMHFLGGTSLGRLALDVSEGLHRLRATNGSTIRTFRFRRPFRHDGGSCWLASLKRMRLPRLEPGWRAVVLEDGFEMPMADSIHEDVRRHGLGRHSVWNDQVWFSATDNTNPNRNGRTYSIALVPPGGEMPTEALGEALQPKIESQERFDRELAILAAEPASRAPVIGPGGKVVMVIGALSPGGTERQMCNLAIELDRRGLHVTILTLCGFGGAGGHYRVLLRDTGVQLRDASTAEAEFALGAAAGDERRLQLLAGLPHGLRDEVWRLFSHITALQPDVLHCCLDCPNISGGVAGLLADVPRLALGVRSFNPTHYPEQYRPWFDDYYRMLAESPRARLFANSRVCAADYATWLGVDPGFRIVYNGLETGSLGMATAGDVHAFRDELGIPEGAPVVAGLLRLCEEKRPLVFVRAIAAARRRVKELHAVLAGIGPMQAEVEALVDELGLGDHLHVLGRRTDVATILTATDMVLLTSRIEGTPNALLEAAWFRRPAVATEAGGCVEVVEHGETGLLCPVDDAEALGAAIAELAADRQRRERMGEAGHARVRARFSLQGMVEATLAMYGEAPA